ncbi:MAG: glycosyltransferase [Candidatus Woesearchaeota archaeon]
MKVAILHDYFNTKGGGERLVLKLAEHLKADIYTAFVDEKNTYDLKKFNVIPLISKPVSHPIWRIIKGLKAFSELKLQDYDVYILSGTLVTAAAKNLKPNIWYCHTPPRHVYSQKEWYLQNLGFFGRIGMPLFVKYQRRKDQKNVREVQYIIANSKNVKKRILDYYGRTDVCIVYPPIDPRFKWKGQTDYYLSFARVDPLKRVALVAKAFTMMPDKKLIIASSGSDMKRVKAMSTPNIDVRGFVSEEELQKLVGNCVATIYIPVDEDFGMSPLEGNYAGKPCIGVNEGGLKETILHEKTGYLLRKNPSVSDLVKAVKWLDPKRAKIMRLACEKRAKEFDEREFLKGMDSVISEVVRNN